MIFRVVDVNVAVVASNRATHAGDNCVLACIEALSELKESGCIVLDEGMLIMDEYMSHLNFSAQPGVGDAFLKWVFDNRYNDERCERVVITNDPHRVFAEFPDDGDVQNFDRSDRKYVAVALKSRNQPIILNAVDSDWWNHRSELTGHGVRIHFLCPDLFETGCAGRSS